jgi:predicted ATPase
LVISAIAQALDVKESGGAALIERLKGYLHEKQLLLLLDNFEHILDAAPLIAELLAAAPGLAVLATSRERLHLSREHEYAVSPLTLPPKDPLLRKDGALERDWETLSQYEFGAAVYGPCASS